jgi:catechol 2,3-dioxygenase
MNLDLTRRTLLHLAGASSFAAAAAAARAEGSGKGGGPTFASRTPMRIGMVTLRVRRLDPVADFYRDVIGLAVMERSATRATLGTGGVNFWCSKRGRMRPMSPAMRPGSITLRS